MSTNRVLYVFLLLTAMGVSAVGQPAKVKRPRTEEWIFKGHKNGIRVATIHPDGETMVSAVDGEIRFWSLTTGKLLHTINEGRREIGTLTYTADGKRLIATICPFDFMDKEADPCVMVWYDLATRKKIRSLKFKGGLGRVALSNDGKLLATYTGRWNEGYLALRDPSTGKMLREIRPPEVYHLLAFTPNSKQILTGDRSGRMFVWDTATGKQVRTFRLVTSGGGLNALAISPDGNMVAATNTKEIFFFDLKTGKLLQKGIGGGRGCENGSCLRFVRGGDWLLTVQGKLVVLIDVKTGNRLMDFEASDNWLDVIDVSWDDDLLITGGGSILKAWKLSEW